MRRWIVATIFGLLISGLGLKSGEAQIPEHDTSGKGAVLCIWLIYVDLRITIDFCFPGEFKETRANFTAAIDAINDFIVTNSNPAVSKSSIATAIDKRLLLFRENPRLAQCENARSGMLEIFSRRSSDDFKRSTDELLSIPRKPLMNPCL